MATTILTQHTIGDVFNGTTHNNNLQSIEDSFADLGPWIISGLVPSAGTGLSVSVTAGVADIGGRVTKSRTFVISALTNPPTTHLYLLNTGAGTSNTGTAPSNSVKLGTATTAGGVVTSVNVLRSSGRQALVRPENQVPGAVGSPGSINLANWNASAGDAVPVYGTLPAGALGSASLSGLTDVTLSGTAQGDILYRGASKWNNLAPGTAGQVLISGGASANPSWSSTPTLGALSLGGNLTLSAHNIVTDTSTGMQIGTGATQKLGFFGATPIVQPSSTTDLRTALINLGLLATGGASPLNLNGGGFTARTARLTATSVGDIPVVASGMSGQTGDLLRCLDNTAAVMFAVRSAGSVDIQGRLRGITNGLAYGAASITPASDADVTVTSTDYVNPMIILNTGSWTAGHKLIFPDGVSGGGSRWTVINTTAFSVTCQCASLGSTIVIAAGRSADIRSLPTSMRRVSPDVDFTV